MLRIITANLNGIRSACNKGFLPWLAAQSADVVCLQELKAQDKDLEPAMRAPDPLNGHFSCAEKPGYSGVGLYLRRPADRIETALGDPTFEGEFAHEGRYIQADLGKLSVVSLYLPSGSSSEERQAAKFRFMDFFLPRLAALKASGQEVVVCGDWNIAHKEIDLKNWKSNQKNSGFLPEERAWLTRVFDELGFVDVYRRLHPDTTDDCYTWWSNRGQAWAKNVGWRLDYQIATPGIAALARRAAIYKDQRFSDHAPLTIDYDWKG
jgi:exodeoxyribonuclease-3